MVWGAMSRNGVAAFSFLPPGTTMNGPKYVQMLSEKLKLHLQVHNCQIFMQDGTPCHCSKVTKNFLNSNNVNLLEWPGNSPDLNPIENLWTNIKNKVSEKQPLSGAELVKAIKESLDKRNIQGVLPKFDRKYAKKNQSCDQKQRRPHKILRIGTFFVYDCLDCIVLSSMCL